MLWGGTHPFSMKHTKVNKEELIAVLDNIKHHLETSDSFEGNLEYTALSAEVELGRDEFMARGVWRVGNSNGQGGVRTLGDTGPAEDPLAERVTELAMAIGEIADWHARNVPESRVQIGQVLQRLGLDG